MAVLRRRAGGRTGDDITGPFDVDPAARAAVLQAVADALAIAAGRDLPGDPDALRIAEPLAVAPVGYGPDAHQLALAASPPAWAGVLLARVVDEPDRVHREAQWLRQARAAGIPAPEVLVEAVVDGLGVLVFARPTDPVLVEAMAHHLTTIPQFVASFGALHARIHEVPLDGLDASYRHGEPPFAALRVSAEAVGASGSWARELAWLDDNADSAPARPGVFCHGDYNPLAVYVAAPEPGATVVLNWNRAGVAEAARDVARTTITLWSSPYFIEKRAQRTMIKMMRETLIEAYLNGYNAAAPTPVDAARLRFWEAFELCSLGIEAVRVRDGELRDAWDPGAALADADSCIEDAREHFWALASGT